MADIQFDEEQQYQRSGQMDKKPFFIRLVLATRIVSTDRAAEYVLLGIVALFIIIAFAFPARMGGSSHTVTPTDKVRALTAPGMSPIRR